MFRVEKKEAQSNIEELDFRTLKEMINEAVKMPPGDLSFETDQIGTCRVETERDLRSVLRELANLLRDDLGAEHVIRWRDEGQPDLSAVVDGVLIHVWLSPTDEGWRDIVAAPVYRFKDQNEVEEWISKLPAPSAYEL